jgi:hypothetical protein
MFDLTRQTAFYSKPDDGPVDQKVSPGVGEQLCNGLLPLTSQLLRLQNRGL